MPVPYRIDPGHAEQVPQRLCRVLAPGLVAGFVGTSLMTATLWAERQLRSSHRGPVDYDASPHVITAVAHVLHVQPRSQTQRQWLFALAHWGYGSSVGLGYPPVRRLLGDDARATAVYYVGCQAMACTLFPVLGDTPPPWRWQRDLMISSLLQHMVYAAAVATASRWITGGRHVQGRKTRD